MHGTQTRRTPLFAQRKQRLITYRATVESEPRRKSGPELILELLHTDVHQRGQNAAFRAIRAAKLHAPEEAQQTLSPKARHHPRTIFC